MRPREIWRSATIAWVVPLLASAQLAGAQQDFVNFESGQTRPLTMSADGAWLFALNTPGNSLSIFSIDSVGIDLAAEVPVGLEPVAVAVRENLGSGRTEVWTVNHLSDSVSIVEIDPVDVALSHVVRTLHVGDEPRDIVFADNAEPKAFITTARRGQNLPPGLLPRFNDAGLGRALVWVFEAENPGPGMAGTPLTILELFGDTPRALAVTPDGATVYAAIFQSGNGTTAIHPSNVIDGGGLPPLPPDSPYAGASNPNPPPTAALIVRFDPATGEWNDELERDWSPFVLFDLPDYDVFAIDAEADPPVLAAGVSSFSSVGTTLFNLAVRPSSGSVFVSNMEARNEVRFEPIDASGVQGNLTRTRITVIDGMSVTPVHANPHVDYGVATGPQSELDESLAFLTDMVFSTDGATLYAAALGSNQVAAFDAAALEGGTAVRDLIDVGRGPSGVVLDDAKDRLYVLNGIDQTISTVTDVSNASLRSVAAPMPVGYDPTPAVVRDGRGFLYDARNTSGHGDTACATCHVFGDFDSLAWDLGDPYGALLSNPNPFVTNPGFAPDPPPPFHPVKGPMTTQSLRGLADAGPMHWRGDRTEGNDPGGDPLSAEGAFKKFNPAFVSLLGRAQPLPAADMQAFTDFILTVRYPPNPVRALDGSLDSGQAAGLESFLEHVDQVLGSPCNDCHALPLGTNQRSTVEITDTFKVPHLRNLYQKVGMFGEEFFFDPPGPEFRGDQVRGFGLLNDGTSSTLQGFVRGFDMTDEQSDDLTEFLFRLDTGLHAAVGQQITLNAQNAANSQALARLDLLRARDLAGDCDVAVALSVEGDPRTGAIVADGSVWLDRSSEPLLAAAGAQSLASQAGGEQTYTCHPPGTGKRAALDRDGDGVMNGDERDEGSDPGDSSIVPFDCVGGSLEEIEKAQVKITKNNSPSGDERISIKGEWLPLAGSPAIDLLTNGLNVLLRDGEGRIVFHRRIVGGWAVNDPATKWTYKAEGLGGGIMKARVSVASDGTAKVQVKGKASDFRVTTDDLTLEVVLGGNDEAATGRCATRTFQAPACELRTKTLRCG